MYKSRFLLLHNCDGYYKLNRNNSWPTKLLFDALTFKLIGCDVKKSRKQDNRSLLDLIIDK